MTVKLSPIVHIEVVVNDPEETYQFLNRVFGAEKVEEDFVKYLDGLYNTGGKTVHVNLGGTVLQLIQPNGFGTWGEQLKQRGPSIHNITFKVENIQNAISECEKEGFQCEWQTPIDVSLLLGPDTPKPTEPNACMIDTTKKLGFKLELFHKPTK